MSPSAQAAICSVAAGALAYLNSPGGGRALVFALAAAGAAFAGARLARRDAEKLGSGVSEFAGALLEKKFPRANPRSFEGSPDLARTLNRTSQDLKTRFEGAGRQSARLSAVLDEASEGVLCVSKSGRITVANTAARRMLAETGDIIGRNYWEAVFSASMRRLIEDALETGGRGPIRREVTNLYPSENFYMASAVPPSGERSEAVLILFDSTEFKKLERAQKNLVTNISHEIRTPLTSIIGAAEQIAGRATADDETQKLAAMLERNTRRLARLCSRIITLSELEHRREKGAKNFEIFSISDAIQNAAQLVKPAAEGKKIEIKIRAHCGLQMKGDRLAIESMLVNLIENAVKYSPDGQSVEAAAESGGGGEIKISVTDRGEGIGREETERIFERFHRTGSATESGSGLGLSIAREAAEMHGGRITVESRPGKGSVFTFRFPTGG